jgi:hypothetical protein
VNNFTIDPSVLTIVALAACLLCIYMVFFFGRRLQTSAYLRDSLIEGARQQELKILLGELQSRAREGPLEPTKPPPDGYGPTLQLWEPLLSGMMARSYSDFDSPNETPEEKARREKREAEEVRREEARKQWETEERVRYEALRKEAERQALDRAQKKVPTSIDISLLGGGWGFLLEFSTVIVIIFSLLILGILKVLEGKEIATILAAIAGYVLGKATSTAKSQEKERAETPISQLTTSVRDKSDNRDTRRRGRFQRVATTSRTSV